MVGLTPRPHYPQGKSTWYSLDRRLGGTQSRSGRGGEEKNSQPPPGIDGLEGLHRKMFNEFYFGSYLSNIIHTSHEVHVECYSFSLRNGSSCKRFLQDTKHKYADLRQKYFVNISARRVQHKAKQTRKIRNFKIFIKCKVVPVLFLTEHHAIKAYWGSGGIAPHILDLGTRWR
jgi:hypothetical protein